MKPSLIATRGLFGMMFGALLASAAASKPQALPDVSAAAAQVAVRHAPVCPGPAAAGTARCHSHVVVDSRGQPLATSGPSGYGPADLRSAYAVTGSGSSNTIIAIVDAYGYPNAESDLAVYR